MERRRRRRQGEGAEGGGESGGRGSGRGEEEEAALRHLFFIFSSCAFRRFRLQGGWRTACFIVCLFVYVNSL